ncbi:ABC transporter substrate-binding protein [Sulfurospirillum sp. 1612]|uniref:ABC transporter substrate-binding protein n=1 Tax=Sulfurospirillum sp. 1612 TaxID=3094835 RepID=UPI002F92050D
MKIFNLFLPFFCISMLFADSLYRNDDAHQLAMNKRVPSSHIVVFMPTMPYLYVSKLINGTLVRSSDNAQGWEYMMATHYKKISPLVYEFHLREGVKFQDNTPFDADSVVENFKYMMQTPFNYSDLFGRLKGVKKVSQYVVRFYFNKPYELFLFDLTLINLYSHRYLKHFGWGFKNASTANSMKSPGPYGLGPYILEQGYATGRAQTPKIELIANPNYYEKPQPYIERITIYTELKTQQALDDILKYEGRLDISPIPFDKKVETVLSLYAKLMTHPSTHNISIYFNMLKPNGVLKNKAIRIALNEAINQENLLKFVYKEEGILAPSAVSPNYKSVKIATQGMQTYHQKADKKEIKKLLNGLVLRVCTMERFMFLWKGIEYQLQQYGVTLKYQIITSEKGIYEQLLTNRQKPKEWDILTWGNDDWSSNNPWTVFFNYRTSDVWSTIDKDDVMQGYIQKYFELKYNSPEFIAMVKKIIKRAYDEAYMLFVPSPNIVLAVNKEVDYTPSSVLMMPLWKAKITPYHWSVRSGHYPDYRKISVIPRDDTKQ